MGEGRNVYRVLMGKPEEKAHLEDQGVDGRMGSKWTIGRLMGGGVEWIHLAQDRDLWRAVVNAVMNLRVPDHGVSQNAHTVHRELVVHLKLPQKTGLSATC
jgi:hypothetical protein